MLKKLLAFWGALAVSTLALLVYFVATLFFAMQELMALPGVEHVKMHGGRFTLNPGNRTLSMFDVPMMGMGTVVGGILGALVIVIAAWAISKKPWQFLRLDRISFTGTELLLLACAAFTIASPFIERLFPGMRSPEMDKMIEAGLSTKPILTILAVGVVAPFFEELIFRGWLFARFESIFSARVALVITSVMFTLTHVQYAWPILLVLLIMSFLLGALRMRTGSLWPSVLLHCTNNTALALILLWNANP